MKKIRGRGGGAIATSPPSVKIHHCLRAPFFHLGYTYFLKPKKRIRGACTLHYTTGVNHELERFSGIWTQNDIIIVDRTPSTISMRVIAKTVFVRFHVWAQKTYSDLLFYSTPENFEKPELSGCCSRGPSIGWCRPRLFCFPFEISRVCAFCLSGTSWFVSATLLKCELSHDWCNTVVFSDRTLRAIQTRASLFLSKQNKPLLPTSRRHVYEV